MVNSTLTKINDEFHSGLYTAKVRRDVWNESNLCGMFPVTYVNSPQVTVTDMWKGEEIKEQVKGRAKKLAPKGTDFRKIRASMVTPSGLKLEKYGIELDIELRDMIERGLTVPQLMSPVSQYLAEEIDNNIYQQAVAVATDKSTDYGLTNNWTDKEIASIIADMTKLRNYKRKDGFKMDYVMLGLEALTELQIKAEVQDMEYTFPKTGFTIDNAVQLSGMTFMYGGGTMNAKEFIAFQSDLPALELFYLNPINPKVQKVPSIGKYDKFVPLINVLKWDNSDKESEPILSFQFTTSMGTYAPEKGERLVKIEDVLSA